MPSSQITLRNVKQSVALTRRIRDKCESLEKFHPDILHCRVTVEQEEARSTPGARPFQVTLVVVVPGRELVVDHARHVDAHLAVRDAFIAMRRQLKDAASVGRGEVKTHSQPLVEASE
jgi:ribosome-associated translation inhibitor RaiA